MLTTIYGNDITSSQRVNEFLEAKGRNSISSKAAYASALKHLGHVIDDKYSLYNNDNIIDAILNKEVDVYELVNNFISYAMNRDISPKSRTERFIYISDEATTQLQRWNDWKYKNSDRPRKFHNNDLVFTVSISDN